VQTIGLRVTIFLVVLRIALYGFAQFVRRTSMFFPDKYPNGDWNTTAADEMFTADDGVQLHGWLYRAVNAHAPLLVWMHGNGGNITERAPIASELARRGVSVLLFDWRGYGKSAGEPSEDALYHDALAAVDFARAHAAGGELALYGESLGGPYAAYAATRRPVRCVVIENSFPSLTALGNALYPIPLGWFAPHAMTTLRWLNDARVPMLVLHGRRDQVIPFPLGKALFAGRPVPIVLCNV